LLSGCKGRKLPSHDVTLPKANITLHDTHLADPLSFSGGCQLFATKRKRPNIIAWTPFGVSVCSV
jgi:hypothetical protein